MKAPKQKKMLRPTQIIKCSDIAHNWKCTRGAIILNKWLHSDVFYPLHSKAYFQIKKKKNIPIKQGFQKLTVIDIYLQCEMYNPDSTILASRYLFEK